jgi:hypothetical protein
MNGSRPNRHGERAWFALVAGVVAYDAYAFRYKHATMSKAFYELSRNWRGKVLLSVVWAVLTAHLFRMLPERFDPLRSGLGEV